LTSTRVGKAALNVIVAVAVVASFTLLLGEARRAIDESDTTLEHDALAGADTVFDTYRCVQAKIDSRIPPGSRITIKSSDVLWLQRGVEGSYPRYEVTTRVHADYVVTITPRGSGCDLIDVAVSRAGQR
jgi:hypothetical protein